jgi:hypothetical protein
VVEYDKSRGAAFYCANHLDQAGLDYYFSDNLPDFRRPTRPTSEQKIDGISPGVISRPVDVTSGQFCKSSIYDSVTPHEHIRAPFASARGGIRNAVEQRLPSRKTETRAADTSDIEKMPILNAYELSRVPTERRTLELIQEAKKTPTSKFKVAEEITYWRMQTGIPGLLK